MLLLKELKKQVDENGNRRAISALGREISYGELNAESTILADYLLSVSQLSKSAVIGIYDSGSVNHFLAMLACLKAGKIFINLDVQAPESYNTKIISDLNIDVLLTTFSQSADNFFNCRVFYVENILKNHHFPTQSTFPKLVSDVAYIVATSGTTGKPKMVAKTRSALDFSYVQIRQSLPFLFNGVIQQTAPLHYAFGLDQSLIFLCSGTTVCIDAKRDYVDLKYIYSCIEKNQANIVFWSSPILKLLSRQPQLFQGIPACVKYIVVGGEPLIVSAAFLFELRNREISLLNNYGCTEMGTMFFSVVNIPLLEIQEYNRVSIGKPLQGFEAELHGNLKSKGELLVCAEKIFNKYCSGEFNLSTGKDGKVYYHTGDIAEKIDGKYYIVGRADNCVNVRGFRIEIESIERHIIQILGGADCCIVPQKNEYDEIKLICFFQEGFKSSTEIFDELKIILPDYMVPAKFFPLKQLPKLSNGKINRKILSDSLTENYLTADDKIDENYLEQRIKKILEEMLNIKLPANFEECTFAEIGLDSLSFVDFICKVEFIEKKFVGDEVLNEKKIKTVGDLIHLLRLKK